MPYEVERRLAVEAVLQACRLCRAVQREMVAPGEAAKDDRSPVTVADFGAQALVANHLRAHLPADPLVGEEDASLLQRPEHAGLRAGVVQQVQRLAPALDERAILAAIDRGGYAGGARGRYWALDPIDGTKGFLRREQYAVALALIEDGRAVLGVLGCPNLWPQGGADPPGFVFVAVRGQGAFARGMDGGAEERLRVSAVADPARAVFCESVEAAHSSHGDAAVVARILGVTAPPLRLDSQAKYACVARGEASIYLRLPTRKDYQEKIWDHAAGAVVIEEAGGRVSDCRGAPLDFSRGRTLANNVGVVATNNALQERVLAAVQSALRA
jgi:3'(2'), 5'-bisphosphate nucleotidase